MKPPVVVWAGLIKKVETNHGQLEKKVAVITGAASGIGRSTAIRFAGEGAAIVIADLNREGGESAARECKETGGNAVFQLTDVAREEDIKNAVDRAVKEFDRLDIMYNNAGLGGSCESRWRLRASIQSWSLSGVCPRDMAIGRWLFLPNPPKR